MSILVVGDEEYAVCSGDTLFDVAVNASTIWAE